jgi:pyruvate dehydrogenase E2 component (dihydrolipoamide acetyltransferase)
LPKGDGVMAEEVFIPKLGQTVEEVTLIEWLVEDGARVKQGDEILKVETDKAIFAVEATASGYLHIGSYEIGQTLPVLAVVAIIGKEDETFQVQSETLASNTLGSMVKPNQIAETPRPEIAPKEDGKVFVSPRARRVAREKQVDLSKVSPSGGQGIRIIEKDVLAYLAQAPKATPLARRMAEAQGIDLSQVQEKGSEGRVTKQDVLRAMAMPGVAAGQAEPGGRDLEQPVLIPLKGVRELIAQRMAESAHTTARVTLTVEVDATELVALRQRLKERLEDRWGFAPGYNDIIGKIVAFTLKKYTYMNARLNDDVIEQYPYVNLGVAVDTERGLLVPVIQHADRISLRQFGEQFRQLVEAARKGSISPDYLSGGTFTITNLGQYDIDVFTPVINYPEVAILGIGRIAKKVAPYKDEMAIRDMLTLSLVFDHRLVDGAPAAKFLQEVKWYVEDPALWLLEALD